MRCLIDTHIVLWWYFDSSRLNREHLRIIADGKNDICVSAAAIWEIEVKRRNGKLDCPIDMMERISQDGFTILPIKAEHLVPLRTIPLIHNDPFDRIIISQAMKHNFSIITSDTIIPQYDVETVW